MTAGGLDDVDVIEGLIGLLHGLDDLVPVWMPLRRQGRHEPDQLIVASRPEIGGGIAQRMQVDETDRVAGVALDIGVLRVPAEPIPPGPAVLSQSGLEAKLGHPGPLIRSQTSDHPGLLGGVQLLESDLDLKLVIESRPRAVVSKIVLVQPQPTTWANLWFQHCSKSIDDIALAGVVLTDENGQRRAKANIRVEVSISARPERGDKHVRGQPKLRPRSQGGSRLPRSRAPRPRPFVAPWTVAPTSGMAGAATSTSCGGDAVQN